MNINSVFGLLWYSLIYRSVFESKMSIFPQRKYCLFQYSIYKISWKYMNTNNVSWSFADYSENPIFFFGNVWQIFFKVETLSLNIWEIQILGFSFWQEIGFQFFTCWFNGNQMSRQVEENFINRICYKLTLSELKFLKNRILFRRLFVFKNRKLSSH